MCVAMRLAGADDGQREKKGKDKAGEEKDKGARKQGRAGEEGNGQEGRAARKAEKGKGGMEEERLGRQENAVGTGWHWRQGREMG